MKTESEAVVQAFRQEADRLPEKYYTDRGRQCPWRRDPSEQEEPGALPGMWECFKAFFDRLRRCDATYNHFLAEKRCVLEANFQLTCERSQVRSLEYVSIGGKRDVG